MLQPKLVTTLKNYSRAQFLSDLLAGVIVGVVAIPLAIAFGIASGVTPEKGLFTAIVAGFLVSLLGGSRVQIGGPTGAFVVIVYGVVQKYGYEGLVLATILAGILLVLMGFARLGTVIQFVPHPVVVGFTSGIALIIFSSQVKDFLGLPVEKIPVEFLRKWAVFFEHIRSLNIYSFGIAAGTVLVIALWPRFSRRIPGSLVAIIFFAAAASLFHLPVETIQIRFGELPRFLPAAHLPLLHFNTLPQMVAPAFTIALLGGIESLLSAVVADGMIGGRHRSNMELVAQGIANISSAIFGGIPATGAIARTATNIKNGGRTPIAGIVHAVTVLVIMLFAARWVGFIPMACLAGVLVVVAYHMSEWRSFAALLEGPKSDAAVLLATFGLTVIIDLTAAIQIGMVLSAFLFMHRMAEATHVNFIGKELEEEEGSDNGSLNKIKIPDGIEVYEINGPFFFGASHKFEEAMRVAAQKPRVRILRLRNVPIIDATGLHSLKEFHKRCRRDHIRLVVSGLHSQPLKAMRTSGLYEAIGAENFAGSIRDALRRAQGIL
ncbi:MAG: sulfate permease [Candidatus Omnitrophica bacterium]|nr:sulfate permease [Candidatus Omnitrophota bacterium]